MPFMLERYGNKAIVVNTKSGKHYSTEPIPLANAKAQMRILETAKEKKIKESNKYEPTR
jgi:hypothetical protein